MKPTAIGRCPACGATRLEDAGGGTIQCGFCGARMDRELRPLPPIHLAPGVPMRASVPACAAAPAPVAAHPPPPSPRPARAARAEGMPTTSRLKSVDSTWIELDPDEAAATGPTAPRRRVPPPSPLSEKIPTATHMPSVAGREPDDEDLATRPRISAAPPVAPPRPMPAPPMPTPGSGPMPATGSMPATGPAMPATGPGAAPSGSGGPAHPSHASSSSLSMSASGPAAETVPGERPSRSAFAPPPPPGPFAAAPPKEAFDREAQRRHWSSLRGDGGPPAGLDTLVLVLGGVGVLSTGLWWRSNAPVAGVYLLPLLASLVVLYFFWKGKNWARFLYLLGSMGEIALIALALTFVRRMLTAPEMLALALRVVLDIWVIRFSLRPDVVTFFERASFKKPSR